MQLKVRCRLDLDEPLPSMSHSDAAFSAGGKNTPPQLTTQRIFRIVGMTAGKRNEKIWISATSIRLISGELIQAPRLFIGDHPENSLPKIRK